MQKVTGIAVCRRPTAHSLHVPPRPGVFVSLIAGAFLLALGVRGVNAAEPAGVVINEILAANATSGYDPQNQYEDWIELYNAGDTPVNVGGMYLTDDLTVPTKWQIPVNAPAATTIASHGFLLVWADEDTADAGLHANFKLSAQGELVGLFAADGTTEIDGLTFDEQYTDISWGRCPDGDPNVRALSPPTPGAPNVTSYAGIVDEVQVSPATSLCTTPVVVTLTCPTEDAEIYYTFDGTDPFSVGRGRPMGTLYTGPLYIPRTVTLKAIAWRLGWRQSPMRTERYIFVGADIRNFISSVPIVIVDTLGKGVSRPQTLAYSYVFNTNEQGQAIVGEEVDFAGRAAINIRGQSSSGFAKHQFHLETWDEQNKDKAVSILGFPADSDWVIQGPYADKSLMRNVLAYQWSREMGQYAVRTRFVELFVNSNDDSVAMSDYMGVYAFMEKIKLGPNRVDVGEPPAGASGITGGYIIKKDKPDGDDPAFYTSRGQELRYADPNRADLSQQERDWIVSFMNAFEAALYGANFTDPAKGYAKFIDVNSFIDHHIVVETAKNIDGFRLSTYMSIDHTGRLRLGPVWDYDLSLGNANYADGWNATGWYYSQLGDGDYPYWRRLFLDNEFKLRYADRWFELRRDLFSTERMMQRIEDHAALIAEPAQRNFQRWLILGMYVWPNWFIANTWREEVDWMKGWLATRLTWMDSQIAIDCAAAPPAFSRQGGHVTGGFALAMTAKSGAIYYSTDGSDPRLSAGSTATTTTVRLVPENAAKRVLVPTGPVADGWRGGAAFDDSAWTSATGDPGGVGFERATGYGSYITCDVGSRMYNLQSSCLVRIPFTFAGNVADLTTMTLRVRYDDGFIAYLNGVEIARRNFTGTPAWNSAAEAINDDAAAVEFEDIALANFAQTLRQGGNILAIHALNQSPASSDFLISVEVMAEQTVKNETSKVYKYTTPVPIPQTTRIKARILNSNKWSALNEAVFAVGPVAQSLRISEIMYHPADPNAEFIELTNIGAESINLNLVRFTNGVDFTFPGYDLAPGGYGLVVRDPDAFQATYGSNLPVVGQYAGSLDNAGERIVLLDPAGTVIHDFNYKDGWFDITDGLDFSLTVSDPQTADANAYDDKTLWRPSAQAGGSPGADDSSQAIAPGSVVINELLANSQGSGPDWIELYNTTDQPIDLGGWFLSDDANDLTRYEIAAGTIIPAKGLVVFYEDRHFANEADPGCHEPFGLSGDGETLYLHSASAGVLGGYSERQKFDASEAGVSLGRYRKSTGDYSFVALSQTTPGAENAAPQVGPIVINEIMYHPSGSADAEYVELLNISDKPLMLYDVERLTPWRFTSDSGVDYLLPPVTLPAGGYLLLVKDTGLFGSTYGSSVDAHVLGWGLGNLSDSTARLELNRPGDMANDGTRQWIHVDRVTYSDGSHPGNFADGVDPWPTLADGSGSSLNRTNSAAYGDDAGNWEAVTRSPGRAITRTPNTPRPNR